MSAPPQRLLVVADTGCDLAALGSAVRSFAVGPDAAVHLVALDGGDPLTAIADALFAFDATELILGTRSRDLVDRALARFGLPVVVVPGSRYGPPSCGPSPSPRSRSSPPPRRRRASTSARSATGASRSGASGSGSPSH